MLELIYIPHKNIPYNNVINKIGCIMVIIAYSGLLHNSNNGCMGSINNLNTFSRNPFYGYA